ncbi:MAG: tRNA (N(6)-L-threonylcarbamoyladenosine(37)-C(2))-methylthiotransferase MtaB [candidate division Zixibacteria bacterium]|nr:tRNA (N(6)-L-threonylcarbamoyladenosine(37)-C(2))-methylthiotransferase MtaB [candidate division Zixibacteria bacterium]
MLKAAFNAVGCKLNQYEVQAITESLEPYGFQPVPFTEKADLYVINTCTVTGKADYTSRQMVRRALRKNPSARVIITGCYAELEPAKNEALSERVAVIGNSRKADIPRIVLNLFGIDNDGNLIGKPITRMNGHSRAFIKIQEGCREKCTYCIIWKARGRPISREPEEIVDEINALYENGYHEVVLTGVHIGRYKKGVDFTGLLKTVLQDTDMPRLRLSSLKPNEFKDKLIELIASESRICPHVHLPVQSGDDTILKSMGRKYKADSVGILADRLIEARLGITIGADIIVGFPGESDTNFENTVSLIKDNPIHHLHVFSYSDRPGTPASSFENKVSPEDKAKRSGRLRRIGNRKKKAHAQSFIGKHLDIIVEDRQRSGMLAGISGNYHKVEFAGDESLRKQHIHIDIDSYEKEALRGNPESIKQIKKG